MPGTTSRTEDAEKRPADPVLEWMGSPFIRVASERKHGQWYVIAEDYMVAGAGPTEEAAIRDLARLLYAYLQSCYEAGMSISAAQRRLPRRQRLLNLLRSQVSRASRGRTSFGEEGRFFLPSALHDVPTFS